MDTLVITVTACTLGAVISFPGEEIRKMKSYNKQGQTVHRTQVFHQSNKQKNKLKIRQTNLHTEQVLYITFIFNDINEKNSEFVNLKLLVEHVKKGPSVLKSLLDRYLLALYYFSGLLQDYKKSLE